MNRPKLIILYGKFGNTHHEKQQRMIDGKVTCGYRPYAEKYGEIIYLAPQRCRQKWESSIPDPNALLEYLILNPDAIVWSVKHDPAKDDILRILQNKTLYYSCCNRNMYNRNVDFSLVDTRERVKYNAVLWGKGKDPEFWKPDNSKKIFDYALLGRRADKNELYFIERLGKEVKEKRNILWIGGKEHIYKAKTRHHELVTTPVLPNYLVRDNINKSKIGILFTEHPAEGFPQSFIEMAMCGVPVVYNKSAPCNTLVQSKCNSFMTDKLNLIKTAENARLFWSMQAAKLCRNWTKKYASLEMSYKRLVEL